MKTNSGPLIKVRVQRVTVETAEIEVPMSSMAEAMAAGSKLSFIDPDQLMHRAVELAKVTPLDWQFNSQSIDLAEQSSASP